MNPYGTRRDCGSGGFRVGGEGMNVLLETRGAHERRWERYPAYRDSGVEWIGEVPVGWEKQRIKHTTYVKGRIGWKGLRSDEFIEEGPFLVTGTDFIDGQINWTTCYHVAEERYDEDPYIQLRDDDLLITKDGSIGKTAIVSNLPDKACLNSGIFLTRTKSNNYITKFMYWLLNSQVFTSFIDYKKAGSMISHLYQNVFEEFAFPTPPLPEQHAIAAFLDEQTACIDALIGKKGRQIELLKENRAAIISHAVTKGLDPDAEMKDSGVEWLGEVPAGWDVLALKRLASLKSGESITVESIDKDGDYPVFGGNGLRGYTAIFTHNGNYVLIGRQGALCGNINYAKGQFWASEHAVVVSPIGSVVTKWLGELLRAMNLNQYSVSAAQPGLSVEMVSSLSIPTPPLPEQHAIAAFLDRETAWIDALTEKVEASIAMLREYRTALISAAVTGKIDVREEVGTIAPGRDGNI